MRSSARLPALWPAFDSGLVSVLALLRGSSAEKSNSNVTRMEDTREN